MTGRYEIFQGSHSIGVADVTKEGLYYRFRCNCNLTGSVFYKIAVQTDTGSRELGVLVPKNGVFLLDTKVPAKYFGSGSPKFSAIPHLRKPEGKFFPISPEEPFSYLARLRKAHMEQRNGQTGIVLEE